MLLTTIVVFFLAEMGDKTQLATVAIAAQYSDFMPVVIGTTLGMMIANAPVVFLGEKLTRVLPLKVLRAAQCNAPGGSRARVRQGDFFDRIDGRRHVGRRGLNSVGLGV